MCGILTLFGSNITNICIDQLLKKIVHRGPDNSSKYEDGSAKIGFVRLGIIDLEKGNQPFELDNIVAVTNGEIYNYKELKQKYFNNVEFSSNSDCEIIPHLYKKFGFSFMNDVDIQGMFAFIIYNKLTKQIIVGRDFMGIIPLYIGYDNLGNIYFSSELKGINHCNNIEVYKPGSIKMYTNLIEEDSYEYYKEEWFINKNFMPNYRIDNEYRINELKENFIKSVESHMMSDAKYGVLLSGGLDSSLVASIVKNKLLRDNSSYILNTFSIGLEGSPDLKAAVKVAEFLQTKHHSFTYTIEEGLSALKEVIFHTETYDTTTIRSSIPMYLLSRKIKALGFKMVLSGEGADEMFGGYLYFHKAPNAIEFQKELVLKMKKLHYYDNLRANKSMLAWGIEARVPFQDKDFITYVMNIDPRDKMCSDKIQKYILRKAFDQFGNEFLPDDILWRQKEQFSDGVGYGWIDSLKKMAELKVSDNQMSLVEKIYPKNTPNTKEEFMYRMIFESIYSKTAVDVVNFEKSIACSTESALKWEKLKNQNYDPSGLCIDDHINK